MILVVAEVSGCALVSDEDAAAVASALVVAVWMKLLLML